ncbi:pentapeptide repeat-containing protein [Micromonospora sp. NPDC051925]|uniref:pentapeptide repeat-containing protein n=1 Tax=Micromonospora sp. NPDC051925 TaxID=3364288 RepID=UPI0037CA7C92
MSAADLSAADLSAADLSAADLSAADLARLAARPGPGRGRAVLCPPDPGRAEDTQSERRSPAWGYACG